MALGSTLAIGQVPEDTLSLQMAYSVLHVIDWNQTRRIAASDGKWRETNPLLGPYPSQAQVNRYFAATLLAHWGITYALPTPYRPYWQGATILLEASVIQSNYRLGISAKF